MLESVLGNFDGERVSERHVRELAAWQPRTARVNKIPFVVARLIAPDASGIPLLTDLAAMRDVATRLGANPDHIEPMVDMIVDHSLIVDRAGLADAIAFNMQLSSTFFGCKVIADTMARLVAPKLCLRPWDSPSSLTTSPVQADKSVQLQWPRRPRMDTSSCLMLRPSK